MEIVISIAARIAEYTVAPVGREVGYLFFYNGHFRKLCDQVEHLKVAKDSIERSIEEERRNGREIEPGVQSWFNRANKVVDEAKKLSEDPNHSKVGCSRWSFPNLRLRHQLSRKAKKMAMDVADVQEKGRFDRVGFLPPLDGIRPSPATMGSENFESRISIMNEIIRALTNPKLSNIGVFGFGGVGKTTLMKEVAGKVKEEKLFDAVVMASVTQAPDCRRIQGEIADLLGLRFSEETVVGRAYRLRERIKREETILIILDNLWARIDLEEVGIPLGNDHEGCKVLLTSRNQDVLHEMEIQKDFRLEVLSEEETWSLFEVMAGDVVKEPSLHHIATEVAKKCAGLPILIVTVARALKNKDIHAWKDTLKQLSRVHNREIEEITYSALELSYNRLEGEEVKALFLLCGVLEAFTAITDLLKYGMGLGLFKHINTIEDARNKLYKLISALKASCLLFENDTERVSMHDIVREVAVSIAYRDQHVFSIKKGAELKTWPTEDILKICPQIILPCHVHKLPERLSCPELKFLYFNSYNRSMEIPNSFFEGIGTLTVLDFSGVNLPSLPTSFNFLTNLQTLCLDHCALGDISAIGTLRKIEILSLLKSSIYNFPNEIRQLARLRMLDLTGSRVEIIQPSILSSFKNLEELYMGDAVIRWEVENSTKQNQNASLAELKDLHNLTALEIQVQEAWFLPRDLMFEKLERYKILIGDVWEWSRKDETSKTLKLKLHTSIRLEHGIKTLLKSVENLCLDEMREISNVLYQLNEEGFPHLKHLHIQNNAEIQYIVNSMGRIQAHGSFPHLKTMVLHNLKSLKKICHGQLTVDSFSKLRVIKVKNCDQVEYLFSFSMRSILPQLVEIEVSECSSMRNVVFVEGDASAYSITGEINFHQLHSLALRCLPALDGFLFYEMTSMTSISMPFFSTKVMFPNLETLELDSINLKELWGGDQLSVTNCVQNLTSLIVKDCGHLKYLLSPSMVGCFSKLKRLEISKCHMMEEIISREEGINSDCSTHEEVRFPKLETITLSDMENLKTIWHHQFRGLKTMEVKNCEKLVVVFPSYLQRAFSSLETLMVTDCGSLEEIFKLSSNETCSEEYAAQLRNLTLIRLPKLKQICSIHPRGSLCFPNLKIVRLETCENMEYLFPLSLAMSLLQLEELHIKFCGAMKEIVAKEEGPAPAEGTAIFVYNRLNSLLLWGLFKLEGFYAGNYTLVCPSLKSINVFECWRLNLFQTKYVGCQEGNDGDKHQASLQQPLFSVQEVIPNLEELTLNNRAASIILQSEISADFFSKIKLLRVAEFEAIPTNFPYWFFQKVPNLERLIVQHSSFKEIFQDKRFAGDEGQFKISKRLKLLRLFRLSELKHICKEGFQIDPILEVLELLSVEHCSSLLNLMPSSVTFCHLIQLEVRSCTGMKNLISSNSTVRSLVKLMTMKVQECNSLEEIVTEKGGETEDIVFPTLHTLELVSLPRLNRFYSSQCLLSFPRLQKVVVKKCPRIKTFSEGATYTPMLQKVQVEDKDEQLEDLNEMIEKMFTDKVAYFSFKDMRLSEYPELKGLWYSQEKLEIFSNLKSVVVHECDFLSDVLFTSNLLQALHNLEELEVSDCGSLEAVFDMQAIGDEVMQTNGISQLKKLRLCELPKLKHVWKKDPRGTWCFQNLCAVFVKYCEGLKNIFPFSIAKKLMQLEQLWVESCGIEEIVAKEEGVKEMISFVFPLVTHLTLFRLSNLRNFYPGRHISEWQSLKKLEIWECYNVEMFAYEFPSSKDTSREDGLDVLFQQPLFSFDKVIPNLELLVLNAKDAMRIWNGHYQANLFQKLKCVALDSFHQQSPGFLRSFLQIFPPLLEFAIGFSSFETIFPWEGVGLDESTGISAQFRQLCLRTMTELKYIWNESSQLDSLYQNLELLGVAECSKSLAQLRMMSIKYCEMMEHVVNVTEVEAEAEEITFENLESLQLCSLSEFKSFISGKHTLIFPSLRYLEVTECPKMKIFSPGVLTPVLNEVKVEEGKKHWHGDLNTTIKHLFIAKALLKSNHVRFSSFLPELKEVWLSPVADNPYRNLKTLTVDNCGFLSKVIPNHIAPLLHNLEELKVESCDLVEVVFDLVEDSLESSSLKRLYLSHLPKLKHVWKKDPQGNLSFQYLSLVHVKYCESLKNIFPPSIAKELIQLQELEVNSCEIEEIVAKEERVEEERTEFVFPHLTTLRLQNLSNLMNFYPGKHNSEWPSLKNLEVWHCPSVEIFPSDLPSLIDTKGKNGARALSQQPLLPVEKVAFHSFQHLEPFEYPQPKELWYCQLGLPTFHNLKSLVVQKCEFLSNILFSSNLIQVLLRLEELEVRDCDSLEAVFDMKGIDANEMQVKTYTRLKKLILFGLPKLKHVWKKDSLGTVGFHNLHAVSVAECVCLKNLFPLSIARELIQLEELSVDSCGIEEIVAKEEGNEEMIKFVFPNLSRMVLTSLWKLKAFYAGIHSLESQSLKIIDVFNCQKFELFNATPMGCQEITLDHKIYFSRQHPLFTVEEVIPNLEELTLNNKDAKMILRSQFSRGLFYKLKLKHLCLSMFEDDQATFPNWVLQNVPSLESLAVEWSSFKEIFLDERLDGEKGQMEISTQLKILMLVKLPELQHICKQGSQIAQILEVLEFLKVVQCSSLINLVPPSVTFSDLTSLEVANCNGLISLITPSTAKSLVKLKIMRIEECNSLKEIMNGNGDETSDEMEFSSLEKLELICLPRLGRFCSSKCFIKFPLLEKLVVMQCPRMEIFSNGDTSTPYIWRVQIEENGECCWEGNLNRTIKKMFANMVAFYSLNHLKLSEYPELKDLWYGQLQQKMFGNLKSLVVQKCDFLSDVLLSPNLLPCLNNLEELEVRDCDSLETVFDAKEMLVEGTPQLKKLSLSDLPKLKRIWKDTLEITRFGNLHSVHVFNCPTLKNMFSVSLCQYLVHLEDLHIESCGLEEIVAKENGSEEHRFDFPQLTKMKFSNLTSLKSFYPGRHSLECHSLKELSVYHCEALQIFSFDHSGFLQPLEVDGANKHTQQALFTFENVCPNLDLLTLNEKDAMMVINGHYQPTLFSKVNILSLQCFHETPSNFPDDFLQAFPNLVTLQVRCSTLQQLFPAEGIGHHGIGTPSQFRELCLWDLDQLRYIWNEDFQSDALAQKLERLQIVGCPSLVVLVPSSISFQSLTTLYVDGCKGLTYLIRSLTAKSLVRLTTLAIKNCEMIEQVVIDEEEAEEEFTFESLEYLELTSLSSFKSFSSGKHTFIFPSLVGLIITGCPKMESFSPGVIIAPLLTTVEVENQKKRWKDDLNSTIKQLFMNKEVQQEVKQIVQTPLSLRDSDDRLTWKASFSGEASEGKGSNESCERVQNSVTSPSISFPWQAACEMKIPQRLISFIWKLHNNALPIADKCHLCDLQSETLDHLFLHCTFAKAIWFGSDLCLRTDQLQPDSIHGWLDIWFSQLLNHRHEMHDMTLHILLIMDNIWQARNKCCMEGYLPNAQACLMKVKGQWKEYRNALIVEECVLQ